jgi:folylpolyglutamate synthase/dihydropteroate synthase
MHEKWSGFNLRRFGVEAVALSKVYIPLIEKEGQIRKYWISCTPVTCSSFKSKESRIRDAIQQVATQGRFYRQQWMREFDEEFIDFPQGRTKDILDAASHCINMLQVPDSVEDIEEGERAEEELDRQRSSVTGY